MLSKKNLLIAVIFTMYFSFLYMSVLLFIFFVLLSSLLIYIEKNYLYIIVVKYKSSLYMLYLYLIVFSMPFVVIDNYSTPIYCLLTLWSILLAIIFLKDTNIYFVFLGVKYLLFSFILFTLIYLYITYGEYALGYHLENMISDKVSANGVTSFLNIILGVYTALSFRLKKETTFIASLFVLYISIEGYGRGSIIFSLVMILINSLFVYKHSKLFYKMLFLFSISISVIFLAPYIYDIYLTTKLASGFETPRTIIFHQYINKIDTYSLFFGSSYNGTIIAERFHNNPHITYIRTHHIFGIFYLFALICLLGKQFFFVIKKNDKTSWLIFLVILNILIRNVTEPLFFPSLFDSLFLVVLFLISKKEVSQSLYHRRVTI